MDPHTTPGRSEPRWPAVLAVLAVIGVRLALPRSLEVGPWWVHAGIVTLLLVGVLVTHEVQSVVWNHRFGFILAGAITIFLIWSLVLLVLAVPDNTQSAKAMIRSAVTLWVSNILVFACWYWRLDGGGPNNRELRARHPSRDFLFPQMTLHNEKEDHGPPWSPAFVDYLFLAFNTSTAFSPTDTAVLTRPAKVLTMLQASISLTIIVVLAARAINIA